MGAALAAAEDSDSRPFRPVYFNNKSMLDIIHWRESLEHTSGPSAVTLITHARVHVVPSPRWGK